MSPVLRRSHPLRPLFVVSILLALLLLVAYGWIERRWTVAGFYLAILAVGAVFLAPPVWSYTRTTILDESPEGDEDQLTE